jgi:hypothetical protein
MALPAKAPKIVEIYMATLKEYQQKLKKEKLTVLMQVGDFFEIYGAATSPITMGHLTCCVLCHIRIG